MHIDKIALVSRFTEVFGRAPTVIARAPGRIEFIGNHTDYNGGEVLGAAIDRYVWVAAAARPDDRIRLHSTQEQNVLELRAAQAVERTTGGDAWANYPLGVWRSLEDFSRPRPGGFDLLVSSNLPAGAGLSSSAALELSTALALLTVAGDNAIDPLTLAQIGRHAENRYVGVPCGILDQGTSAHGRADQLVRIDCRGPHFSLVPLPGAAVIWVFNTREKHALVDGLYATRHRECQEAAALLGVKQLCELSAGEFAARESRLPTLLAKRARHVIEENDRVRQVVEALAAGQMKRVGELLIASHRSSQHLFENSTPALDSLVDLLQGVPGVLGARLTGGGFGGAVMALTTPEFTATDAARIAAAHAEQHTREPEVLPLQIADGATLL